MSFIAITTIGLKTRDEGSLISTSLFSSKFNISVFLQCALAPAAPPKQAKRALFPKINRSNVSGLNNTIRGMAMVCAADDLELSFNGENGQIEIFDNFVPTNPQQFFYDQMQYGSGKNGLNSAHFPSFGKSAGSDLSSSYHSSHFGVDEYSPTSLSSGHSQNVRFPYDSTQLHSSLPENYGQVNEFGMDFLASHQSHFDIMASGVQLDTRFTDFKRDSFNDGSSYGSSIESFDSPLDEMFLPRQSVSSSGHMSRDTFNHRKRRPESPVAPEFGIPSENIMFKRDSAYEGQKKIKRESVGQLTANDSQQQDFSKPRPEVFFNSQSCSFLQTPQNGPQSNSVKPKEEENGKARYTCNDCDAAFKVKSYLTRHIRKHNNAKAFVCPFYREQDSEYCGTSKAGTKCHPTGGFSRKDTYKTHLKALHFIYPPRTKSSERGTLGGRCAGCFTYFESNSDWFKHHIEDGSCKGFVNKTSIHVKQEMSD